MAGGSENIYVVHNAVIQCTMGIRQSRLVLEKSHGVFIKDKAQISIRDKDAEKNIICFGGCHSSENPNTVLVADQIQQDVRTEIQWDFEGDILGAFTVAEGSGPQYLPCVGICEPIIVSAQWDNGKPDVTIEQGHKPLLEYATLTCKYGGIIQVIVGQWDKMPLKL